jgi:cyclophilin family peptidyl-prolyl cis-trans isomerase
VLEVQRAWAPHGVDRFHALVRAGYYDDAAVFRVRAGVFAQFGIHGDPAIARRWQTSTIPDDPLGQLWSL